MFVFDTEEGPHAATSDFGQTDEEADQRAVLEIVGIYGVEYPIKTEDRVNAHG